MPSTSPAATTGVGVLRLLLGLGVLAGGMALLAGGAPAPGGGPRFALRFAPLGFVAVFACTDRGLRLTRALLVGLPAFALGLAAAALALWLRDRSAGAPGPSDLLMPAAAVALGVAAGLAWRRGLLTLALLPFKLAIVLLAIGLLAAVLLAMALEKTPSVAAPPPSAAAEANAAADPRRAGEPQPSPSGDGRTLRLTGADLDRLLARSLPPGARSERMRLALGLGADGRLSVTSSTRAPFVPRWLNAVASARVAVRDGRLDLGEPRLRLARFEVPQSALQALAPLLAAAIQAERPVRSVLATIRDLHAEPGALVVSFGLP